MKHQIIILNAWYFLIHWPLKTSGVRFLRRDKRVPLLEASKYKNVLLMSDAGMGKSYELQHLAHELSNLDSLYYPILVSLEGYSGKSIKEVLPERYQQLEPSKLYIIFDGYDELSGVLRPKFSCELKDYINNNKSAHILVSARSNFCKAELNDNSNTFSGFEVFDLCNLTFQDVKEYIEANSIDSKDFYCELRKSDLNDLVYNPFYLINLSVIFKNDNKLPCHTELMGRLLELQLKTDDEKFCHIEIETLRHDIKLALQQIAFAMQLMQKTILDDEAEYQAIFPREQRELVKHCGVFTKVKDEWRFIHNNFREYLAAELMKNMTLDDILRYIANYDSTIKENWINTLSYLVPIRESDDLFSWLVMHNPNALVKFERRRVNENTRNDIFCKIFNKYETNNMWFHDPLCNEIDLVSFAASEETLLFLLEKISRPVHFQAHHTALMLLKEFQNLFGKEKEVLDALISCCKNPATRGNECRIAIVSIALLNLNTEEITTDLVGTFEKSTDDYIRLGMYEYLIQTRQVDEYVDFLISGMEFIGYHINGRVSNESFELISGLKSLTSIKSIQKVLDWFNYNKLDDPFFQSDEVYETLCKQVEKLFKAGTGEFMVRNFLTEAQRYNHKRCEAISNFFTNTKTKKSAIEHMLIQNDDNGKYYLYDELINNIESLDFLAELYIMKKLDNKYLFLRSINRLDIPQEKFGEYLPILTNLGVTPSSKAIDYNAIIKSGEKAFFDTLFDRDRSVKLLHDLLIFCGDEKLTRYQLYHAGSCFDIQSRNTEQETMRCLWHVINRYNKTEELAADFFDCVSWEEYSDSTILNYLKQNNWLRPDEEQLKYIERRIYSIIKGLNFASVVTFRDEGCTVHDNRVFFLTYFLEKYGFKISDDTKLDMLILPSFVFEGDKYELLCKGVSERKVNARVEQNILSKSAKGQTLYDHLEYCSKKGIHGFDEIAKEICLNTEVPVYNKRTSLEYLLQIKGEPYFYENLLTDFEDDLFLEFTENVWENRNEKLISELEKRYQAHQTSAFLRYLILLNSEFGLKQYIAIVSQANATPRKDDSRDGGTAAIGLVNDPARLPLLISLIKIRFQENFEDNGFDSLYRSLMQALCNIPDSNATVVQLNSLRNEMSDNLECVGFCSQTLSDINTKRYKAADIAFTVRDVLRILQN